MSAMNACLSSFSLNNDIAMVDVQIEKLKKETLRVEAWMGMAFVLTKAKDLADGIGGLSEEQAYNKVSQDLQNGNLDFNTMSADVAALNLVCRNAMTVDFLAKATADAPIDMTSFIQNPNIYQSKDKTAVPDGWVIADWGSRDNKEPTTEGFADAELHCGSWSGNNDNNIGKAHYYSEIGGTVSVPDGLYRLAAATFITRQPEAVALYASTDNVEMTMVDFNRDRTKYDNAVGVNDGTTTSLDVQVRGGVCISVSREKPLLEVMDKNGLPTTSACITSVSPNPPRRLFASLTQVWLLIIPPMPLLCLKVWKPVS